MSKLGERVVTGHDGRALAVAEWGLPDGVPVFSLHAPRARGSDGTPTRRCTSGSRCTS